MKKPPSKNHGSHPVVPSHVWSQQLLHVVGEDISGEAHSCTVSGGGFPPAFPGPSRGVETTMEVPQN